jgi:hypothetical protein
VGTRVLCVRGDSAAVAQAIRRARTGHGPQGQKLAQDELVSIVEVLPSSKRQDALRFDCDLSLGHDACANAARMAIAYVDTPEVRSALRQFVERGGGRDSSFEAVAAVRTLARWAHRDDLPTFHLLALSGGSGAADEALEAIGRIEGPQAMADWIEKRYQGPPPRDRWWRYVSLEYELRHQRR